MNSTTNTNGNSTSSPSPSPNPNPNPPPAPAPSSTTATLLTGILNGLPNDVLDTKTRSQLGHRSARCPDELIQLVSQLAQQSGGNVAGMAYDPTAATNTLTQVSDFQTQLSLARQLVQRLEDEVVQTRVSLADPTFAIYTALRRLTKTTSGNALLPAYQQMQLAVKNRPRKTRAPKKPKLPGVRALKKAAKAAAAAAATTTGAQAPSAASSGTSQQQAAPVATGGANPKA
jgi:hypothetical protein